MRRYYIGYKTLKKRIKHYSGRAQASDISEEERHEIVKSFSELLDSQVRLLFCYYCIISSVEVLCVGICMLFFWICSCNFRVWLPKS